MVISLDGEGFCGDIQCAPGILLAYALLDLGRLVGTVAR